MCNGNKEKCALFSHIKVRMHKEDNLINYDPHRGGIVTQGSNDDPRELSAVVD